MSIRQDQPHANPCADFSFHEQDESQESWLLFDDWRNAFFIPELFAVSPSEQPPSGAPPGLSADSPGPFLFEPTMDWEPLLEPGFKSTEMLVEYHGIDFDAVPVDADLFNCPSPLPLTRNSPTLTNMTPDGSSWAMSPIQPPFTCHLPSLSPRLSPVSSQEDLVPHIATSNDQRDTYAHSGPKISPVVSTPSNDAPFPSCTKVQAYPPRLSVRDRELATHNVRVNRQVLIDKLEKGGHSDKIEALDSLLEQIGKFVLFRESHAQDQTTRASVSPPGLLRAPVFSPFLGKRHIQSKPPTTRKTLLYYCLFCDHKLPNRTQMIQHLMAQHFRYFPHECGECDATFCRPADLIKHGKDKHSGVSVACRCGKTFSNQRNYQRHQKPKNGLGCLVE